MPENQQRPKGKTPPVATQLTTPGLYLLVFAVCGWLVLVANLFGIAGRSGWIFPPVPDVAGLAASTLLLAVLGLTPFALRQLFRRKEPKQ